MMSIEILVRRSRVKLPLPDMINYAEKLYNEREYFREKMIIISVKIPKTLFEKLEKYRRKKHISRSKAIRDMIKMVINSEW
jgi:hypothetical protein